MTDEIIEYAVDLSMKTKFEDIPKATIEKMKMIILDSIGVAYGGAGSESAKITMKTFDDPEESSSLWGFNRKSSEESAVLTNGVSLRFLDYLEYFNVPTPKGIPQVFHMSEILPLIFAVGEKQGISGKELLTSFYIGTELSGRLCASVGSISLAERGFHHSTLGYIIAPLVAGRLLGLNREQMINAVSLGALHSTLGIVDAEGEAYFMSKNFAFPFACLTGLRYARLAKNGFTSSPKVITGNKGFIRTILNNDESTKRFFESPEKGWVSKDSIKSYPVCGAAQSIAETSCLIGQEENLNPGDIKKIVIRTNKRSAGHVGDPAKRHPTDKETADHSASFIVALGILKGKVTPSEFIPSNYADKSIYYVEDRVIMEHDEAFDPPEIYPAAQLTVETTDGREITRKSIHPMGHHENPITTEQVIQKFRQLSESVVSNEISESIIEKILNLENVISIGDLPL